MAETFHVVTSEVIWGKRVTIFWNLKNWGNDEDFNHLLENADYPVEILNEGDNGPQARLRLYFQVHNDQPPWLSLNAEQVINVGNRVEQYGFQVDYVDDGLTVLNNETMSRLLNSRTVKPGPTGHMIVKVICPALTEVPGDELNSVSWTTTGPFRRPQNLGLKITVTPCYIPVKSKIEECEEAALAAGKNTLASEGADVTEQTKKKKVVQKGVRPVRSLMCLGLDNPLRRACYAITEAKPFEYFILVTILATCACLALATPYPNNDSDVLNDSLEEFEIVFTVIFTAECAMSIIAKGLIAHEGAYLRNIWNCLDFTIVSIGLLSMILSSMLEGFDVKALRAFRVLRPLKLVSGVPSLQIVMNAILMAMVPLFHIALLVLFVIVIYAIIGLEMFEGKLHQTCFHNLTGEMMKDPANCGGGYNCEDENENGNETAWNCRLYWEGPYDGIINFDNIVQAMLTVFTCISLEGWSDLMYKLQDAMGTGWEWLYFTTMVVFGAFMVMNLIVGVLCGEFSKQKEKAESRIEFLQQKNQRQLEKELEGYLDWITTADDCTSITNETEGEGQTETEALEPPCWKTALDGLNKYSGLNSKDRRESNSGGHTYPCKKYFANMDRANHRLRRASRKMIKSQGFYWTIIVLVFLNTMVLATEHYQQPQWLDDFQNLTNVFFVALFTGEMLLKMYSLGISRYFVSLFNRFDFFATISSILELWLNKTGLMAPMGVSVLRCVRLLRVFKVTRYWKALSSLVGSILGSIQSIVSLIFLLFLFIMIFALLGMQIFGGKFNDVDPSDYTPRTNFDAFTHALLTVFQILTGEDWNEVMYLGILGFGGPETVKGLVASLYFIILFVLGNLVMLNVFLAIAVDNLELEEEEEEVEKEEGSPQDAEIIELEGGENGGEGTEGVTQPPTDEEAGPENNEGTAPPGASDEPPSNEPIPAGSAFFILSQTNPLRVFCFKFIIHPIVGNFLLVCILVSSALMGAEDPVYEQSEGNLLLEKIDYFFTTVFTIELTVKLIVYGLVMHKGAFLRSGPNVLDFVVVAVSLISVFASGGAVDTIKILRIFRVLRPLRAINRAKGLKRVIQCMIVAIKTIGNIVVVTSLLTFMYAVMGVQLFKGGLFQCTDPSKITAEECQGDFLVYDEGKAELEEREWLNSPFNFDSVPNAMLTLFAVCTFEGWPQMLYKSIDSAGQDKAPEYNNRLLVAAYYVSYLIIISLFMINIFVGFVIMTFQSEGEKEYAHSDMEKNQRNCLEFALSAKPIKVYIPSNRFQYAVWRVTQSTPFANISFGLIILNTMSMGMKFYEQPDWYTDILDKANLFFTVAFTIEFLLKLVALGVSVYCSDAWNVFDAVIVMGSYVDIIFPEVDVAFLKLFRVGRLIKLLNKSEGIRKILFTFIKSFQTLPYVILLLVLLFFIYAIIGMSTFSKIALDEDTEIHRNNNFQNFGNTALLLFRCATGEAWQEIMMACSGGDHVKCFFPPEDGSPDKCGSNAAYPYFITFVVSCSFLVLNLFVAVIMDHFDYLTRDSSVLGSHHLGEFIQQWSEYDPDATGKIRHDDLVNLLRNMEPPLGFGRLCPKRKAWKRLVAMNMPMNADGSVSFNATLFALVRTGLQIRTEGNIREADEELRSTLLTLWKDLDPKLLNQVVPPPEDLDSVTVGKFYATLLIQQQYRKYQKKKVKSEMYEENE